MHLNAYKFKFLNQINLKKKHKLKILQKKTLSKKLIENTLKRSLNLH